MKDIDGIQSRLREIGRLENEADGIYRESDGALFANPPDILLLIKWRELYGWLEETVDACKDLAMIDLGDRHQGELTCTFSRVAAEHLGTVPWGQLSAVVWLLIALALLFDFLNGFHDAANSVATVVSTRVLSPADGRAVGGVLQFRRLPAVPSQRGRHDGQGHHRPGPSSTIRSSPPR